MRSASRHLLPLVAALAAACGGSSHPRATLGGNVLPLTVGGASCRINNGAYPNKPCVEVTVCLPGTSTCSTVADVLVDTGSFGLRLFKEVLPFSLPPLPSGAGTLAECVTYLTGATWGPVAEADVVLGGEPSVRVPVQVIDATFGRAPTSCVSPESHRTDGSGYAGILGVGVFAEDCGPGCAASTGYGLYYACTGTSCVETRVPLSSQVVNPVTRLPTDNNGVIVDLPAAAAGGQVSVSGSLILGIDTQANNRSAGATAYPADPNYGEIRTSSDGAILSGIIDTGSNGFFFPAPRSGALPECTSYPGWFCPSVTTAVTATNAGVSGVPSGLVTFSIGNASTLFRTASNVFGELGGPMPGPIFDFGLPFFLGRKVYVGLEGTTSALGTGPYFGY